MTIGRYETVRLLGNGGMSDVYEVVDPRLESRHALKLFSKAESDSESRERFLAEGRLLAKLNHPRIVKVTDFGVDEASGRPYFVMELVLNAEGVKQSLDEVPAGSADEEMIGRWYDDLREGLAYIHGMGVVHRDLKLQNVLIGPDGHAVLTDFGISRIFDAKGDGNRVIDTVQTIVRMREGRSLIMGSIGYMAPELEMGVVATPASDWYALGVIVYKLLTGTWCDARTDVLETLSTYDPVWRRIIPKLLHANPEGRECLSYEELKREAREAAEFQAEERWLAEKRRGHLARHVARYISALAIVLSALCLYLFGRTPPAAPAAAEPTPPRPSFVELFSVPATDPSPAVTDVWRLVHDDVDRFCRGNGEVEADKAVLLEALAAMRAKIEAAAAEDGDEESLGLEEILSDDIQDLLIVLDAAINRLKGWTGR